MSMFLMPTLDEKIELVTRIISNSNGSVSVLTGAGISVNSGIPDFRGKSKDSFYNKYPKDSLGFKTYINNRALFVEAFFDKFEQVAVANPNRSHDILVEWENEGVINGVATQNVDGLHKNKTLFEIHGNLKRLQKMKIVKSKPIYLDEYIDTSTLSTDEVKDLILNHDYKPDIVLFGEDVKQFSEAKKLVSRNRITLIIGTRMEVYPFAGLPDFNKWRNRRIVIINNESLKTSFEKEIELIGDATEILEKINLRLKNEENNV